MSWSETITNTCGDITYASCMYYEECLGENTGITGNCVTIEDTTKDLYTITDSIIKGLDTSNLGNLNLTYTSVDGKIPVTSVFEVHEVEIDNLKQSFTDLNNLQNLDVTSWGIDFGCLVNVCNTPTVTLGDALNNISKAICEGVVPPVFDSQPIVESGRFENTDLILTKDNSTEIVIDASSVFDDTNLSRIVSGEVLGTDMVFTRGDSTQFGVSIANLINSPNNSSLVSGTLVGNSLVLTKDDSTNITVDLSDFKDDTNLSRIESTTVSGNTLILTRGDTSTLNIDLSSFANNDSLPRVTSGSVSGNTLTLMRDDNSTFDVDVSSLVGGGSADGNDFITSASLVGSNLILNGTGTAGATVSLASLTNTDSQTLSVSGNNLTITGGNTVTLPSSGGITQQSGTEGAATINITPGGVLSLSSGAVETLNWIKTGNIVHFQTRFPVNVSALPADRSSQGNVIITGLPFTASFTQAVNYSLDGFYGQLLVTPFVNDITGTTITLRVAFRNLLSSTYPSTSLPQEIVISGSYITN